MTAILRFAAAIVTLTFFSLATVHAANVTWQPGAGGSWATPGNWNPAAVPNSTGSTAVFNSPTANRTVTNDSGDSIGFTVNGLSFDVTGAFTNTLTIGAANSLLNLNNGGAGSTISVTGAGTGNTTISVPMVLVDTVTANVAQTTNTSAAGALNLTGAISGNGGFTKTGAGVVTFGTAAKTYIGPTIVSDGRFRVSTTAQPANSSSFTVNGTGQIVFAGAAGNKTLGAGNLNLNGTGSSQFPGAIRVDTGGETITNPIVLQSNASINVPSAASLLILPAPISGPGRLELGTLPGSPVNQGAITLSAANSYQGGTLITQGVLNVSGAVATLGSGNVLVDGVSLGPNGSIAAGILSIQSGVLNAISDSATLTITGDDGSDAQIGGKATLGAGISERVGALVLGGVNQTNFGTYGSTASNAQFKSDLYFSGAGVVALGVPEPASLVMAALGAVALIGVGLRRRAK